MSWGSIGRIVLSLLPDLARAILNVQRQLGVDHPTIASAIAEWILRGDRRETVAEPPGAPQRASDDETPGGGS